jgi:hypothetical protein
MVKTIEIYDNLRLFDLLKNLINKKKIFYIKQSFFVTYLNYFFRFKRFKELKWNLIENKINDKRIITSIKEDYEVDSFVYEFLVEFEKDNKIEKNFYHYLVKHLSNNKNLIGFMSVENFLVLYKSTKSIFKNYKIVYNIETSEFNRLIKKKFENDNSVFLFYFNSLNILKVDNFKYLIKFFFYIFFKKKLKNLQNKLVCVMDSYEINKPEIFFSDKNFYDKTLFITNDNKKVTSNIINVNHYVTTKIYLNLLYSIISIKNLFKNYSFINFLYIKYKFEKEIYYNFFIKSKIKIFLSSYIAQPFTSSIISTIHDLKGYALGFTMSYPLHDYSSHLNIDAFDYFFSCGDLKYEKSKNSNLKKLISLGYVTDYKFLSKKNESNQLREKLLKTGAEYILGFFDQGYDDNTIFSIGYLPSRSGYKFLLEKVISNEKFALIIKPKKPKLLKTKLSKVYWLLEEAKKTGRCIVFDNYHENHVKNFDDIPAKIAMASDLTIHDTLIAGSAGLESALVNCKSVYFDYYESSENKFEEKGLNIVFRDWNLLWDEILKDKASGDKRLGKWENIIEKFDTYRDGNTNLRIMKFIENIMDDHHKGLLNEKR